MKNIFIITLLCFFSNNIYSQFVDSIYVGSEKRYIYETPINFFKEKLGIDIEGKGDSVLVVRNDEKGFDLVDENSLNNIWKFQPNTSERYIKIVINWTRKPFILFKFYDWWNNCNDGI
jgi:hypothetical protein